VTQRHKNGVQRPPKTILASGKRFLSRKRAPIIRRESLQNSLSSRIRRKVIESSASVAFLLENLFTELGPVLRHWKQLRRADAPRKAKREAAKVGQLAAAQRSSGGEAGTGDRSRERASRCGGDPSVCAWQSATNFPHSASPCRDTLDDSAP
jgi:hypothetical protein